MKNITVKNISTAKVCLSIPSIRFSRELMPGREIPLTDEEYQEMTFDPGCRGLIEGHFLKVSGVEDSEQYASPTPIFDSTEIARMLDTLDITAFAKFIPNATTAEKESVIKLAVEKGITNNAIVALVKKYCDVDIINAINMKHQAEEM